MMLRATAGQVDAEQRPLGNVVAAVVWARHHFKILGAVVQLVAILVVNDLCNLQEPSKHTFHHKTVFKHVSVIVIGVVRGVDVSVTPSYVSPALPKVMRLASSLANMAPSKRVWVAAKDASSGAIRALVTNDGGRLVAPTLTNAGRDLIGARNVASHGLQYSTLGRKT